MMQFLKKKLNVLLVIEQCNPEQPSVPLVGYNFFKAISQKANVTLCTHGRNEKSLSKELSENNIVFMKESKLSTTYYKLISPITNIAGMNWPLYHVLTYPIYAEFDNNCYRYFKDRIIKGEFDIVHAMTPILPRYPYKIINACQNTPFILGPVNGGLPYPKGFDTVARKEFDRFNFFRKFSDFIPNYKHTYKNADIVLAGSMHTFQYLKEKFQLEDEKITLFPENGIEKALFFKKNEKKNKKEVIQLLFIGRLVPFKGADILLEAFHGLDNTLKQKLRLTIVGDGSERDFLENLTKKLGIEKFVTFTGWVKHEETHAYYQNSDIFCFPSIREFGGAVVLEAMACGLPCIIVDHGGIGEYVTNNNGFKIKPESRQQLIDEIRKKISLLVSNPALRTEMSENAVIRANEFEWNNKADKMINIYEQALAKKRNIPFVNENFDFL